MAEPVWDNIGTFALDRGPWGLIALGVVSIWRGWWIPRWWYERQIAAMEKRIDDYKATGEIWKEVAGERQAQIAILLGKVREPMP
jgi:hypothetical protein